MRIRAQPNQNERCAACPVLSGDSGTSRLQYFGDGALVHLETSALRRDCAMLQLVSSPPADASTSCFLTRPESVVDVNSREVRRRPMAVAWGRAEV